MTISRSCNVDGQGTIQPWRASASLPAGIEAMAARCNLPANRLSILPRSFSSDAITKRAPTGTWSASAIFVIIDNVGSRLLFSNIERYETEHSARVATSV